VPDEFAGPQRRTGKTGGILKEKEKPSRLSRKGDLTTIHRGK